MLRRVLGPVTGICVGLGAAIGSGIFATPGDIASLLHSPGWILGVWLLCGGITLMQSLVSAELATRFPEAGGEYQYLKAAYGDFAAFFFGWSATIFIIGGGAGTIAAALGGFASALFDLHHPWAGPMFGCAAIVAVTAINALGLRTGAATQNILTSLKVVAVLAITAGAIVVAGRLTPAPVAARPDEPVSIETLLLAMLPAFWAYTGTTDSIRLAAEIRDVRRALPRALVGSALIITVVYIMYNYALLCALAPAEMAGARSVPALVFEHFRGTATGRLIELVSVVVCLGAISACMLANVRIPYALARDGLAFRFLGRMSARQAPVGALMVSGGIACCFVLNRSFSQILRIYFLASAVLFGLTYLSLIVFRLRDRRAGRTFPANVYKTPAGIVQAGLLIALEIAIAASIIRSDWRHSTRDSLYTLALLAGLAALYAVWRSRRVRSP